MEIDNCLEPFTETILLDQAFKDSETSLGDQRINELSVHGLETLAIQFKEDGLVLSSRVAFRLNRTREKLVINHSPLIGIEGLDESFLRVVLSTPRRYGDKEEPPRKVYENRYRDEAYISSLGDASDLRKDAVAFTPLDEQIKIIGREHNERLDDAVLNVLIGDGRLEEERRELFHLTLSGACQGCLTQEEIDLFHATKEAYLEAHGEVIERSLQEEIAHVKKWGSVGEADMMRKVDKDINFYVQYNEANATARTEWILRGAEVHNLRFFNLKEGVKHVDCYNRSSHERPTMYGTLNPGEQMRISV